MNGMIDSSIIKSALENPEMLAKAMSIARELSASGVLSGLFSDGDGGASEDSSPSEKVADSQAEKKNEGAPREKEERRPTDSISADKKIKLLEAMKPFVSDRRREGIDTVIKIVKMLEIASGAGF